MIIICEPQCAGFEHTEVNAALLAVANNAFPDEEILFLAEKEHVQQVMKKLKAHSVENVTCEVVEIPTPGTINLVRLPAELRLIKQVFELAIKNKCSKILFASVTSAGLFAIKILLKKYKEVSCLVVPHGILESVVKRPSVLPWHFIFWFRFAMTFGNTERITYVVLGESIKERLCRELPIVKDRIKSITLPTFFKNPQNIPKVESNVIRFGTFGVAHLKKGFDLFFKMAEEVKGCSTSLTPEFILIGHIGDKLLKNGPYDFASVPSPDTPLSRERFDQYANNIDYAIYFYKPTSYQLTASGALFDAFSFVKPIIALRNPFFEYYFKTLGDIGYLCDSYNEMKMVILEILNNKPTERYKQQQTNIITGREQFNLQNVGKQFKYIWEEKIN